ncbi:hypothetical protein J9303_08830 [Bacillaceae bacterium Marseille-Q3522]|nr:hypothetical protein [Bacillaceae bacterium Marseille-Q3522]
MQRLLSILAIVCGGYYVVMNRYRLLNIFLRSRRLRKYMVQFLMGIPGVKNNLMQLFFSTPKKI